jgi:hypothetical protein
MSFNNNDFDDEKLMAEIDKLESNYEENVISSQKDEDKKKFINNIFFVILLFVVLISYVSYDKISTNTQSVKNYEPEIYEDEENTATLEEDFNIELLQKQFETQKENIEITKTITSDKDLIIGLKNNNKEALQLLECYVIFFDGNNVPIDVKQDYIEFLGAEKQDYLYMYDCAENYERAEVLVKKMSFYSNDYKNVEKSVEYELVEDSDFLTIKGKNLGNKKIDSIKFEIVFYNEKNEIVDVRECYDYDIGKNKKFEIDSYISNYLNFSRYEVNFLFALAKD